MKKKALAVFSIIILLVALSMGILFAIGRLDKQFIITDQNITSSYLNIFKNFSSQDSEDVFKVKLRESIGFFKENGINTVIIPFNDKENSVTEIKGFTNTYQNVDYLSKRDILKRLKKEYAANKIQVILELDCEGFLESEITSTAKALTDKYAVAGIILNNYTYPTSQLQQIKLAINKKHKKLFLGIIEENTSRIAEIQPMGVVDLFIFEKINEGEYRRLKEGLLVNENIIYSYKSESFLSDLFFITSFSQLDGVVLNEYSTPHQDLSIYTGMINESLQVKHFNFTVDNTFAVAYPKDNASTYSPGIFVTGSSEPDNAVYINGEEAAIAKDGAFGKYVELSVGENIIKVEQSSKTIELKITRKEYTGTAAPRKDDDTKPATEGQKVETTGVLTSILSNKDDDGSIVDGLPKGTQLEVVASEKTVRGGKNSYAYKLSNGGYVLANKVEWIDDSNYTKPKLFSTATNTLENSDEILTILSQGSPGIISHFDDEILKFTFLNTELGEDFSLAPSKLVNGYEAVMEGNNLVLTIRLIPENEIWGYDVKKESDKIEIYLKGEPKQIGGAKPLSGVTIMLDPGHGAQDSGAPAVGGIAAPSEKELNLAVAQATKLCLEKFGANVIMTREDDTFPTLDERRDLISAKKPDLFISMHHNSLDMSVDSTGVFGTEVYYFTPQSKAVAEILCGEISQMTNRKNRGEKFSYFYVTRTDIAPAVLVEYGFLVNPLEYTNIYSDLDIYKSAFATAQAILKIIPEK